jgi:hypothetical protein
MEESLGELARRKQHQDQIDSILRTEEMEADLYARAHRIRRAEEAGDRLFELAALVQSLDLFADLDTLGDPMSLGWRQWSERKTSWRVLGGLLHERRGGNLNALLDFHHNREEWDIDVVLLSKYGEMRSVRSTCFNHPETGAVSEWAPGVALPFRNRTFSPKGKLLPLDDELLARESRRAGDDHSRAWGDLLVEDLEKGVRSIVERRDEALRQRIRTAADSLRLHEAKAIPPSDSHSSSPAATPRSRKP